MTVTVDFAFFFSFAFLERVWREVNVNQFDHVPPAR
jgi:hypothetical protein